MDLGWQELVIILVIVVIIFGAGKLPEIGGAMGKGIREFRHAAESDDDTPEAAPLDHAQSTTTTTTTTSTREEL